MMKRKIAFLLASVTLFCSILSIGAGAEGRHFYYKKNGHFRPTLPDDEKVIERYDGWFIDKKVSDDSADKVIYLTFDAGYENGNVEKILDALKAENAHGAFFVLEHLVCANTSLVKRMEDEGHLVCNHTKNHKNMAALTSGEMEKNLTDLENIYEEKTGRKMAKYFRFPEGQFDEEALATAQKLGYKTIFWSFAYPDWDANKQPDPDAAVKKILENTHNGEVILLHPTSATNAKILPTLLAEWKKMGYRFGTLDELTKEC